ncbi:MAG TPA: hypothetical protein VGE26_09060 [Sphingobacteriaceae bacterium]
MKKSLIVAFAVTIILTGCSTIQSIVRSTFPYTATLIIPASSQLGTALSATSSASSFDQIFTGQGGNNARVEQIRITSAKLEAANPSSQNLGVFQSVKLYLSSDGSQEIMVASREDVSAGTANNLVLDVNSSRFLDEYLKGTNVKVRMEYVLRNQLTVDASMKASLNFSSEPAQ